MAVKFKIAVIGLKGLPAFGGAAAVGENIIDQLKDKHEFVVYSIASHTHLKTGEHNGYKQIVFPKIPFRRLNTLYYYLIATLHALIIGKYNLVHLHHRDAAFIIPLLKIRYRVIITVHGSFFLTEKWKKFNWFFSANEKWFVKKADIATCVSLNERQTFKNNINLDVIYIPNGVNKIDFNKLNGINQKNYLFFGAGRIIKTKGLDILISALNKIQYKGKVLIAGDMEQSSEYKTEILNLSKNLDIQFIGLIKDKTQLLSFLKHAKYFIFPSLSEAMSMMLLEAASVKSKIICSDIIGNKNVFDQTEVLYFKTENIQDMADKITWALNNPTEMELKAQNAYNKCLRDYNWTDIAEQYNQQYQKLLNK